MSLYDDEELGTPSNDVAVGWSKGIQLMQSQMQAKKAAAATKTEMAPTMAPPKPGPLIAPAPPSVNSKPRAPSAPVLAPVINLKSKKPMESPTVGKFPFQRSERVITRKADVGGLLPLNDPNWQVVNEYDPLWPNDYLKVVQEIRGDRKREEDDESDSKRRRYTEESKQKARERFNRDSGSTRGSSSTGSNEPSGFGRRPRGEDDYSDEEDDRPRKSSRRSTGSTTGGAAIAPPPSLTETSSPSPSSAESPLGAQASKGGGLGIAAKIMAKYGYKQGSGLGRSEQGMSSALSVEKTSKRGGRIVHEKDLMPPPMFGESFKTPKGGGGSPGATPPRIEDTDEYGDPASDYGSAMMPPPPAATMGPPATQPATDGKPSITDLMKNPSKVVLCKNMVGPGEVDDDLEPEIKEECHGKYGDVASVVIFEIPGANPEEAVRIFIEFKRVEAAIKALIDLNGRFFGGREVAASFYNYEKFKNFKLGD